MIYELIGKLIQREGGYVDHPADRGGPTNMGVTQQTLSGWRGEVVSPEEVKALTYEEASKIYFQRYWVDPGFSTLAASPLVKELLLDASVHHGTRTAARLYQRALGVVDDGSIGPKTRHRATHSEQRIVAAHFLAQRNTLIGALITRRPSQAAFAHGWARRVSEFIERLAHD